MLWAKAKITSKDLLKGDKESNVDYAMDELVSQMKLPLSSVIFKMFC